MTTVINSPRDTSEGSGMGVILGVVLGIVLIILFFMYGLPALRSSSTDESPSGANVNVNLKMPSNTTTTPSTTTTTPSTTTTTPGY